MPTRVRSYSKINVGLAIGPVRADGFHGLTTLYQTLDLHDFVTVAARRVGEGEATRISLTTNHPFVPRDGRNTAWRMGERCLARVGGGGGRGERLILRRACRWGGGGGRGRRMRRRRCWGWSGSWGWRCRGSSGCGWRRGLGRMCPCFLWGGRVWGGGGG